MSESKISSLMGKDLMQAIHPHSRLANMVAVLLEQNLPLLATIPSRLILTREVGLVMTAGRTIWLSMKRISIMSTMVAVIPN